MACVEILASAAAPFFLYGQDVVTGDEARTLLEYFDSVPERGIDDVDPGSEFAFIVHSTESGGLGRAEAAAGEPIWLGTDWGRGVAVPAPLRFLQERVGDLATLVDFRELLGFAPNLVFTSTYEDRYLPGGGFFPHTDGDRYGSVIAGVSVGPRNATFALWPNDQVRSPPAVEFTIKPNSIYFFCGPIRHSPWQHAVRRVTDLRYGITWRAFPEPRQSGPRRQ